MAEPFGPYWLVETINVGSIGEVFLAHRTDGTPAPSSRRRARRASDAAGGESIVIKRLHRELARRPVLVEMFREEGRMALRLVHDHLVRAFEAGTVDGDHYIAMELVRGPNLAQLAAHGPVPVGAVLAIAADLLRGLAHMHEQGIVHCDVSPTNVLIGRQRALLADFGVANPLGQPQPQVRGTMPYLSPEQARGLPVDGRSDLFAAATLVWELLARRPLFRRGAPHLSLAAVVEDPVPEPADLPDADPALRVMAPVLGRALAKDPAERPRSCAELAAALAAAAAGLAT